MIRQMLLFAMCMIMRTGNAVITPNKKEYERVFNHLAEKAKAKAKADAKAEAKSKDDAKAEAEAEAKAKAKAIALAEFEAESEPLSIKLVPILEEINNFKIITKTNFEKSLPNDHTSFTSSSVRDYMEKKVPEIVKRMNELYTEFNNEITTFVNDNGSNLKFSYKQYNKESFTASTECMCKYKPTCIFHDIYYGIQIHFHTEFMEMFGFNLAEIERQNYLKECAVHDRN